MFSPASREVKMDIFKKVPLGEVTSILPGLFPQETRTAEPIVYPAVLPQQLTESGIIGEFGEVFRDAPCTPAQILRSGDLLLRRLNPEFAVSFEETGASVVPSANVYVIRPRHGLDPNFLEFLFSKTGLLKRSLRLEGLKTTAAITLAQLSDCLIPLPPIDVQWEIGGLWKLAQKRKRLLLQFMEENDRLLNAIGSRINQ